MKTVDGYIVKTADAYLTDAKDPNDYNYPLSTMITPPKTFTSVIDKKTYDVVTDQ